MVTLLEIPKIEIADDAGDLVTEIDIPIPFYIRVHLEPGITRYRVRLIDDQGKTRGQYIGTTDRSYLELHVPIIKLPKPGDLRILIEESSINSDYSRSHQVSIRYLGYKTVDFKTEPEETISNVIKSETSTNAGNKEFIADDLKLLAQAKEGIKLLSGKFTDKVHKEE